MPTVTRMKRLHSFLTEQSVLAQCLCLLLSAILLLALSAGASAQSIGSATLRGTIKDSNGAVIPDAAVTVVNEATKDERKAQSSDVGIFVFSALNPGVYTLKAERTGFKSIVQKGVILSPGDVRGLDLVLPAGETSDTVTISATVETLQTETGAKENTITAKQIQNLSIISRSSLELLRILPASLRRMGLTSRASLSMVVPTRTAHITSTVCGARTTR